MRPLVALLRRAVLGLLLASVAGAHAAPAPDAPRYYTAGDTILILGAVPQEVPPFVAAMPDAVKKTTWGIPYWQGTIKGRPVVVAITGIGKAFTAATATLLIGEVRPKLVLMSGTGARIDPALRTGDVIVAAVTYEHDYGSLTRAGMVFRPMNGPDDGAELENAFAPPATLLAAADRAIASYVAPRVSANGATYTIRARRGVVASSDLFGVTQQRIDQLRGHFHADIMEMESAPLGHVCVMLGVPFIVVRAGSNVAQEAPNDDYLRLGPIAAKQAALFSLHLLEFL